MEKDRKKGPEVRFKGFTDEWEQRKFSEIMERTSKQSNDSELPKVEFEDIVSGEGRLNKDISAKFDDRKGIIFEPNSILFGKLRPYLEKWLYPNFKGIALGDFWVFNACDSTSPIFDYYLIQSEKFQVVSNISTGTKMPRSDWKTVSVTTFRIPSDINEQNHIGAFFKHIDNIIALHQRKLDKLKRLKKGFMQMMFPQKGEDVPRVKFADCDSKWVQRKLKDVLTVNSGKDYKHLGNGEIPVYGTGGYMLSVNDRISDDNAIGIGRKGTIDKPQLLKAPFWTVDTLFYMIPKNKSNLLFCFYLINNVPWRKHDESTGVPSLSKSTIENITIRKPMLKEQENIGSFFKQLEDIIIYHQVNLEKIKLLKKAYSQKMFI
jgi:type I restriction enzyme S subunit